MNTDPKAQAKIQMIIKAVCEEWGVSVEELTTHNKKSSARVTEARKAVCYIVKHESKVKIPRFVMAGVMKVNDAQVSKYDIAMRRDVITYQEVREKVARAVNNTDMPSKQIDLGFTAAQGKEDKGTGNTIARVTKSVCKVFHVEGIAEIKKGAWRFDGNYQKGFLIPILVLLLKDEIGLNVPDIMIAIGLPAENGYNCLYTANHLLSDNVEFEILYNECKSLIKKRKLGKAA
jgi:hypothetical protein